jgi:methylenetetrahydrofolate dehydrogenase (NADP+)/methenyltetrahydrofolate cyclohydrolase
MILDGKKIACEIYENLTQKISQLERKPKLVVLLVGENPASLAYIKQKRKFCLQIGIEFELRQFDISLNEKEFLGEIRALNTDPDVSGFIVQFPLPSHIDSKIIHDSIDPKKDVDGFTPYNIGCITLGIPNNLAPCTPKGVMRIFEYYQISLVGKNIAIIGRSNIVGKPLALMCISAGATVTVCNSRTENLHEITLRADIIVCATGSPKLLTSDMVHPGSTIIDVGISRVGDILVGDADFEELEKDNSITPVPG